jgi:hypothetical protein
MMDSLKQARAIALPFLLLFDPTFLSEFEERLRLYLFQLAFPDTVDNREVGFPALWPSGFLR